MDEVPERVQVYWHIKTPRLVLDQQARVLLLIEALHHDVALCHLRVECTDLDGQPGPALVLGHCAPVYGVRRWRVETVTPGKTFVRACGNFPIQPEAVLQTLGTHIPAGHDLWQWTGRMKELVLARGQALALAGRAKEPCRVTVEMAGI